MSRASLSLSICLSLGLGLTACGDDSNPGGGGETDTDAGSTTDAPTTDEPTTDEPTTDEPTTDDGTTTTGDPTTDPDTGSETTDPTSDTEGDTETVIPEDTYFQVNSLEVRDPHLFVNPFPGDSTTTVNDQLTTALTTDDPEDPDGFLDLGFVLAFLPLDQTDGANEPMFFTNAQCTAPIETSTCDVLGKLPPDEGMYTSSSGECYAPTAANLGMYDQAPDPPMPTAGPCFSVSLDAVDILAGDFVLPMTDVTVAATYVGSPAGNLVSGNIEGFISQADADATIVPVPVLGDRPLSELLQDEDRDGEGWIFHIAFTAVPVEWTGN